jgi:hypothetical protein
MIIFYSLKRGKDAARSSEYSSGFISLNVPAVYEGLPARIRALRSKDQGWQNVGAVKPWE